MKIGFLGCGKMGGAILEALLRARCVAADEVTVYDVQTERLAVLTQQQGVKSGTLEAVVCGSDVVFLAVKPQDMAGVLAEISKSGAAALRPLYVSIAAGRKLAWLEHQLAGARMIRVMPNLAVSVTEGAMCYCCGTQTTQADEQCVRGLLLATGQVFPMAEEKMDAVTALSGSGPAFLAVALRAFIAGGIDCGLTEEESVALALQTFLGTSKVLLKWDDGVDAFIRAVTSPKGTTAAGLAVMAESDFEDVMRRAVVAAKQRSGELSEMV